MNEVQNVKLSCAPRGMVGDKQLGYRERARAEISCAENIERFHVMDHKKILMLNERSHAYRGRDRLVNRADDPSYDRRFRRDAGTL